MATLLQKKLAKNIVENAKLDRPKNKKELLVSSGYDVLTATHNPKPTIQAIGVKEELRILGFDEETAKKVVGELLLDESIEPKDRLKATSEIFKVSGSYAPEKHLNVNIPIPLDAISEDNGIPEDKEAE